VARLGGLAGVLARDINTLEVEFQGKTPHTHKLPPGAGSLWRIDWSQSDVRSTCADANTKAYLPVAGTLFAQHGPLPGSLRTQGAPQPAPGLAGPRRTGLRQARRTQPADDATYGPHAQDRSTRRMSELTDLQEARQRAARRAAGVMTDFDGSRLSLARRLAAMPRTRVSHAVGVTPAAITQFEKGHNKPIRRIDLHVRLHTPPALPVLSGTPGLTAVPGDQRQESESGDG
jgi:hypothetical protein